MSVKQANSQVLAKITGTDSKGNHEDRVPGSDHAFMRCTRSTGELQRGRSERVVVGEYLRTAGEKFPRNRSS
jgi:hypothetical protein